jgi:hypothetical protein
MAATEATMLSEGKASMAQRIRLLAGLVVTALFLTAPGGKAQLPPPQTGVHQQNPFTGHFGVGAPHLNPYTGRPIPPQPPGTGRNRLTGGYTIGIGIGPYNRLTGRGAVYYVNPVTGQRGLHLRVR